MLSLNKENQIMKYFSLMFFIGFYFQTIGQEVSLKKLKDIEIYRDTLYHSAFPSITEDTNGEFLLVFRRAPNRFVFGEEKQFHTDPNSYFVGLRSDNGVNWDNQTRLIFAHNLGGINDPCLLKLSNGSLLITGFLWSFISETGVNNLKKPFRQHYSGAILGGGFTLMSRDNGYTWGEPRQTINLSEEKRFDALKKPLQASNRGGLIEVPENRILWAVAVAYDLENIQKKSFSLIESTNNGESWSHLSSIATDSVISFNETSLIETKSGDIVAFMRTGGNNGVAAIARSKDGGRSFEQWQSIGFHAEPIHALKLPDENILITYGHRERPYGIRAKILNPEATNFNSAKEIIIRDDGNNWDMGYPWAVNLSKKEILIVYYMKDEKETAYIAGSIMKIVKK